MTHDITVHCLELYTRRGPQWCCLEKQKEPEHLHGTQHMALHAEEGRSRVTVGRDRTFTFDHVFGPSSKQASQCCPSDTAGAVVIALEMPLGLLLDSPGIIALAMNHTPWGCQFVL